MPIIDPSLQCSIVTKFSGNTKKEKLNFFLYYLRIASHYMIKNVATVETSILFRDDLQNSIAFANDELGCDFKTVQDFNFSIKDFYKYLYDHIAIKSDKDKKSRSQKGSYFICNDQFNTKLYRPSNIYSQQHAWFLSDTPVAILCINDKPLSQKVQQYIKLEIDLMVAAGFTLVLCAIGTPDTIKFYLQLIKDNQFSEIHFNIFDRSYLPDFFKTVTESMHSHFDNYKGFFYIYSQFPGKELDTIVSSIKKKPRFKTIFTCESLDKTFKKIDLYASRPFLYCKTGFKSQYLRIRLSNVPLYEHSDVYSELISTQVSGLSLGYISPGDFLKWQRKRTKILFSDPENDNHHIKKYIDYKDLHEFKADLYAISPLLLKDISKQNLRETKKIQEKIKKKDDKKRRFRKEFIFSLFKEQKIREGLEYVSYAYQTCFRNEINDFTLHDEQILTALEACKSFVTRTNDKGMIYQVKTGEGKSCIVCLIAAVLALMGKTVHITSSNIKLANRDYYKSFKFFKTLGFESAILLHENELPFSLKEKNAENDIDTNDINTNNTSFDELSDSTSCFSLDESIKDPEIDNLFGSGTASYLSSSIKSENSSFRSGYYPEKFFKSELFKNPSRMNYSVCGIDNYNRISKNKADIIFSTFINFECLYLRMMETCRGYVDEYFDGCGLIIDEVDSILIDEITNGTIVSREMKSNAKPILKYVYQQQRNNRPVKETYENIVKYWPNHGSLEIKDVEQMYEEIELVNEEEFSNGKKYSIETIQVRNSSKIERFLKKTTKFISKTAKKIKQSIEKKADEIIQKYNSKDDDNSQNNNNEFEESYIDKKVEIQAVDEIGEEEEDNIDKYDNNDDDEDEVADSPVVEFKHIVPFDYDHKGILEPNKEFSGFIQQFIAIKEGLQKGNENMLIKDLSMNYLYVSHPIFVKLYGKVCGFTGTIGSKNDQEVYKNLYNLQIKKVPRNKPNLRVKLPMILCDTIDERDRVLVSEVKAFHDKGFPVLVIFQDLTEIVRVEYLLNSKNINYINIFNGKNELIRPDKIAGVNAAVSLGTNVCGRGTDIRIQSKPLHVILTYYSSNKRVMRQAFGRTARQGKGGTYRIICLKDQYYDPIQMMDSLLMNRAIQDFKIKNKQQEYFIDHFKRKRPWIFSGEIKKQKLNKEQIITLRGAKINVNRIVAYNYEFPICMKPETFLDIQAQKIFSIFNCPNSKYTWILFQRYLREMILESWSLMLNKFDQENVDKQGTEAYKKLLRKKRKELSKKVEKYIKKPSNSTDAEIIPTFIHIYEEVINKYQDKVLNIYPKMESAYKQFNHFGFISCQCGFRPYSLLSNSGARIDIGTIGEMNYIIDPELRYERQLPEGKIAIVSITEKIDSIFNLIYQMINRMIGEKIGLKMFLRRTLGGCEFGLCFDLLMKIDDVDSEILRDFYCLVDKDPLLSFTIFVKNVFPILAGILIIVLVFVACLSGKIAAWISAFSVKFGSKLAKDGLKLVINLAAESLMKPILQKLFLYLSGIVKKQIDDIMIYDTDMGIILLNIFKIFESATFATLGDKISDSLGRKIKFSFKNKFGRLFKKSLHKGILLKIGLILILSIGTFIMNFNHNKLSLKNEAKDAREFDKHYDPNTAEKLKKKNNDKVKLMNIAELNPDDAEDSSLKHGFDQFVQTKMDSFLFKMDLSDPTRFIVNPDNFQIDIFSQKNRIGNAYIQYFWMTSNRKKCFRIQYYGNTKAFKQQVIFYSTFDNPLIVPFIGYYVERKNDFIYHELPENGFLDEYLVKEGKDKMIWSPSAKLIIAYGIASVMRYLHDDCHIVHRDLRPANICLDQLLYPYIYNFFYAKQIDKNEKSKILQETSLRFMAPEFIENPASCQDSFKIDVYSYGMLLYNLVTETQPFNDFDRKDELMSAVINGERPKFPDSTLPEWKELINKCWAQNPSERPSFQEILIELNSAKFDNDNINRSIFARYKKQILNE